MADQSIVSALILGLIEGLTEFIPVSSTAHVVLAQHFSASSRRATPSPS